MTLPAGNCLVHARAFVQCNAIMVNYVTCRLAGADAGHADDVRVRSDQADSAMAVLQTAQELPQGG